MSGIVRRLGREQSPQDSPLQSAEERQAGLATILVAHSSSGRWNLRSRNGLVLSDVGTPVYGVDPYFGSILQPTSGNYVRISGMPNTGYPFTVAMFVRKNRTNSAGANRTFAFGADDFGSYGNSFFHQDNHVFSYGSGGYGTGLAYLTTKWTLVVCVFESDSSRSLYNVIDGVVSSSNEGSFVSVSPWPLKLSFGQSGWNTDEWFGGDIALPMFFSGAMSTKMALELYRNPWPAFEPEQGYVPFASGGGAAALAGGAASGATATGALTTAIPILGAAVSGATASGSLNTAISLAGATATISAAATGALSATIRLAGDAVAGALAAGGLATGIPLAGGGSVGGAGAGDLSTGSGLVGAGAAGAAGTGVLTTQITLSGAAIAQAIASGALTTTPAGLAGDGTSSSSGSGALSTAIPLAGAAAVSVVGTGGLVTAIPLAGAATVAVSATGDLVVSLGLAGAALVSAIGSGALLTSITFSGAGLASALASGALTTVAVLAVDMPVTARIGTRFAARLTRIGSRYANGSRRIGARRTARG